MVSFVCKLRDCLRSSSSGLCYWITSHKFWVIFSSYILLISQLLSLKRQTIGTLDISHWCVTSEFDGYLPRKCCLVREHSWKAVLQSNWFLTWKSMHKVHRNDFCSSRRRMFCRPMFSWKRFMKLNLFFLGGKGVLFLFLFYYLFILQSNAQCGKTLGNVNYVLNDLLFTRSRCYKYQGLLLNKTRKANHSYISSTWLLLDLFSSVYFWSGTDTNMIGHHLVDQISEKASWVKKQTNTALKSSKNEQRIFVLNR